MSHPLALEALDAALAKARRAVLQPPPTMNVPDWADTYRHLSTESGAIGGQFVTSRVEVARGPMMAVTEPGVRRITAMTCTQLLKTTLLENTLGYFMHLDPCPILLTQPKDEAVDAFSKERFVPMVKASPVLAEIMSDRRTRISEDTIKFKRFPGGYLALASAGSPTNLAMRAIRVTLADEIDKYEATKEGDPLKLLEERTSTFQTSALNIRACSPTIEETSRVYRSYKEGDQRRPFVRCPHCAEWIDIEFFKHVQWRRDEDGEHMPETAQIICDSCGTAWTEPERMIAITTRGNIRHQQTKPFYCCGERQEPLTERLWDWDEDAQCGYALCKHCYARGVSNAHASFTASKLFSPFITVVELATAWIDAKDDPEQKQTFENTQLGRPFKSNIGREITAHWLAARREVYETDLPDGVLVLTAGIDVQGGGGANGRLEIEVVGWGIGEESWSIDTHVIHGDPARPEMWKELDEYLLKPFHHASGLQLSIMAACIDSGGHATQDVYRYAVTRIPRNIWAIKGASDKGNTWSPVWPVNSQHKHKKFRTGYRPVMIGVNSAKESIRQRLLIEITGPGYCHFPEGRAESWFEQLTAENLVVVKQHGVVIRKWRLQSGRANEAIDCRAYAYAALMGLYHTRRFTLEKQEQALAELLAKRRITGGKVAPTRARVQRSPFMEG